MKKGFLSIFGTSKSEARDAKLEARARDVFSAEANLNPKDSFYAAFVQLLVPIADSAQRDQLIKDILRVLYTKEKTALLAGLALKYGDQPMQNFLTNINNFLTDYPITSNTDKDKFQKWLQYNGQDKSGKDIKSFFWTFINLPDNERIDLARKTLQDLNSKIDSIRVANVNYGRLIDKLTDLINELISKEFPNDDVNHKVLKQMLDILTEHKSAPLKAIYNLHDYAAATWDKDQSKLKGNVKTLVETLNDGTKNYDQISLGASIEPGAKNIYEHKVFNLQSGYYQRVMEKIFQITPTPAVGLRQ